MSGDPIEKVLTLIREGRIAPEDEKRILDALGSYPKEKTKNSDRAIDTEKPSPILTGRPLKAEVDERAPQIAVLPIEGIKKVLIHVPAANIHFSEREDKDQVIYFDSKFINEVEIFRDADLLRISAGNADLARWEDFAIQLHSPSPPPVELVGRDGDIQISGIFGDLSVYADTGDISIKSAAGGRIEAESVYSDIYVNNTNCPLKLCTAEGDIEVNGADGETVISTIDGDVNLENVSGKISIRAHSGDVEGSNIWGEITIETISGDVELSRIEGNAAVTSRSGEVVINGSAGELKIETADSDIICRSATVEDANVWSASGNIRFDAEYIDENSSFDITTHSGNIILRLPQEINGKIFANTVSGVIEARAKLCKAVYTNETMLEASLSEITDVEMPRVNLKTASGAIRIRK